MTAAERLTRYQEVPVRFTAEEFMELAKHPPVADWVGKIELVGGEIVRMAPANVPHWNTQRLVQLHLQSIFAAAAPEWLVGAGPTIRLSEHTVREPDVAVFRAPDLSAKLFDATALFLAVEIADTSLAADRGPKQRDYALAGVPHYWIVDVNGRRVFVNEQPDEGRYQRSHVAAFGEPIPVPGTDDAIVID